MLATCFPELNVDVVPRAKVAPFPGYWKVIKNQKAFLEDLAKKLSIAALIKTKLTCKNISESRGWSTVSTRQIEMHGGTGLLHYYKGSLREALKVLFPHEKVEIWKASKHNLKNQTFVFELLKSVSIEILSFQIILMK